MSTLNIDESPDLLLTAETGDIVIVRGDEFLLSHQTSRDQKFVYLTNRDADLAGYNRDATRYQQGMTREYPEYHRYFKHVRADSKGTPTMPLEDLHALIKSGNFVIC